MSLIYSILFLQYSCVLSQFKCPAGNGSSAFCIAGKRRCDGTNDCPDGHDEKDCPASTCSADWFLCNNTQCIPKVSFVYSISLCWKILKILFCLLVIVCEI